MQDQISIHMNNFAVFILTHGRPDKIKTLTTLSNSGYTGAIYFIVDNEDKTLPKYIENFGEDRVKIFDKKAFADTTDEGNNFDERRTITHARNACFSIAKELGIKYFIQLDDDYTEFRYRIIKDNAEFRPRIKDINKIFDYLIEFYNNTGVYSVAFAQGGDFIGGFKGSPWVNDPTRPFKARKVMNSFLCSTDREFKFIGAMNEDVNTYTTLGSRGTLFFTIPTLELTQTQTQSQAGGITEMYLRFGTYCKAFTTLMMHPSGVKISILNTSKPRIHHLIDWAATTPRILNERHKK